MNVCKRGLLDVHTTSPQVIDENEPDEYNGYDGDIDSSDIFHSNSAFVMKSQVKQQHIS